MRGERKKTAGVFFSAHFKPCHDGGVLLRRIFHGDGRGFRSCRRRPGRTRSFLDRDRDLCGDGRAVFSAGFVAQIVTFITGLIGLAKAEERAANLAAALVALLSVVALIVAGVLLFA